ncbi:hypothetical protein AYI69_g8038 [Smittium culicis]|uniref:Uncharacterized protein n=1 Tax=Smittium culicis TaxID=133412 RepID=A0A1R1XMQ2_9FUNG|nr:hypothetical protein AYI69_g8038 [Smittium culicis]
MLNVFGSYGTIDISEPNFFCNAGEYPDFNNTSHLLQAKFQKFRLEYLAEVRVNHEIAIVSDDRACFSDCCSDTGLRNIKLKHLVEQPRSQKVQLQQERHLST